MKKMWIWSLFILLSAVSLGWSQTGSAEKAVAAQEQLWLQSQKANNPDQVAPLLSDKIVITLSDGTEAKAVPERRQLFRRCRSGTIRG